MIHQHLTLVHPAAQTTTTTVDEVDAVVLDLEAHQVTPKDTLENEVMPWKYLDQVPGREWNMKEESNLALNIRLLSQESDGGGSQHQMIIMNPDYWNIIRIIGFCHLFQSFECSPSKQFIDSCVGSPVALIKHCSIWHRMEQRPQCSIAASIVIELKVLNYFDYLNARLSLHLFLLINLQFT